LAATGRTIGLGNDADKKIMRFKQRFERCGSDLGRAHENDRPLE
jgi:hypothetical protein